MENQEDLVIPQDIEVPEFKSIEEENEWRFGMIAKTATNLANRTQQIETFLSRGADMIQYKIPGNDNHSNLLQVFDTIFDRLNKIEETLAQMDAS
tara:strand:+ start:1517 stop:1801 length:285 start_codon:yes stop_codon:yes gene_type:complete